MSFADGTWCPSLGMQMDNDWRLQKAQYGDGYQQRMLDGIHALQRRWMLNWDSRPRDELNAMVAYLTNTRANAFPFKDPATDEVISVFCDKWSITWNLKKTVAYGTLTAQFDEAFGLWLALP
jgi:phage-related protein